MNWRLVFLPEAQKDVKKLSPENQLLVAKAIKKVQQNPLPASEGGYGKPLGRELSGFYKIKLRDAGIRVVYKLIRTESEMIIVVVGARADNEVYDIAKSRIHKNGI